MIDSSGSLSHRIRVLIVDDYAAVRQAVATVLQAFPGLELAGEASGIEEALRLCARVHPDVVLMDISLPGISTAAATRAILNCCPPTRVIATCTFQEEDLIPEALSAGAVICLLKNVSASELASTIRAAYAVPSPTAPIFQSEQGRVKNPQIGLEPHDIHRAVVYSVGGKTI